MNKPILYGKIFSIFITGIFLEINIMTCFDLNSARPNIMLIIASYIAFRRNIILGVSSGIFAGFIEDMLSLNIFGVNLILFACCVVAILESTRVLKDYNLYKLLFVFVFSYIISFLNFSALYLQGMRIPIASGLLISFYESAYTIMAAVPLFFFLNKLFANDFKRSRATPVISFNKY